MTRNLFEINESMLNLLNYNFDDQTGEIAETEEDFNRMYDAIELELNTKLDNTNCLIKTLDSEVDMIAKEIKRLQAEKKSRENMIERLRGRIDYFVRRQYTDDNGNLDEDGLNKFKLELPHSKISYRRSVSVLIKDLASIPKKFMVVKKVEPDKTAIAELLKSGKTVKGAELSTNINLQIK